MFFLVRKAKNRALIFLDIISTRRKLIAVYNVVNLDNMFYVCKRSLRKYVTMYRQIYIKKLMLKLDTFLKEQYAEFSLEEIRTKISSATNYIVCTEV